MLALGAPGGRRLTSALVEILSNVVEIPMGKRSPPHGSTPAVPGAFMALSAS
jgi:hypothetical protein